MINLPTLPYPPHQATEIRHFSEIGLESVEALQFLPASAHVAKPHTAIGVQPVHALPIVTRCRIRFNVQHVQTSW
jgi:hypothetical protein